MGTDNERPLLIERSDTTNLALILARVMDDPTTPKSMRNDAEHGMGYLNDMLLYGPPGGDGRSVVVIPAGFHVRDHFATMTEQWLAELPADVRDEQRALIQGARTIAAVIDNRSFSTDFRLDARDALADTLAQLQQASEDVEGDMEVEV
jgi:hypothetical protein